MDGIRMQIKEKEDEVKLMAQNETFGAQAALWKKAAGERKSLAQWL
jgi:hypothetical protein